MSLTLVLGVLLIVISTVLGCVVTFIKVSSNSFELREASVFLWLATLGILIGSYLCSVR